MYDLLAGLSLIEASSFVASPSAGLYCAQMGAEVIRVDQIGHIALVVGNDNQFERLCKIIECESLIADPRFVTNKARVENVAVLTEIVGEAFSRRTRAEWFPLLEAAGLPNSPINTIPQVLELEQVVHRGMVSRLHHPSGSEVTLVGTPLRFSETPLPSPVMPPMLGEHTAEVLAEAGLLKD